MNNNNNPPTAQIIDFDNYDPFGANDALPGGLLGNSPGLTSGTTQNQTPAQTAVPLGSPPQTTFSPTSSSSVEHLDRVPGDSGSQSKGTFSFLSFEYYKTYFDVQGDQVLQRAIASLFPRKGHLEQDIRSSPDLYGPVWISVTLIVTSAISHGVAQFIQNAPTCVAVDTDMRRTSFVTSCVFLYAFLLPTVIWSYLKYQNAQTRQSLPSYMCLYGYSMAVFVPISILWVIRLPIVMWPIMLGGAAVSAYALVVSLWPSLEGLSNLQGRLLVALVVIALHIGLAVSLGTYAFEPNSMNPITPTVAPPQPPPHPLPAAVNGSVLNPVHA